MTNRTLLILSGALVGLLILVFLGERAETPQRSIAGDPLLPDLASVVNDVDRLEVVRAGSEAVATLERTEERWQVLERDGYPADVRRIRQALVALAEARVVEHGTANPQLYERLSVEDVQLESAGGVALTLHAPAIAPVSVIFGDPTERGQRYVRPAGEAQSYLIDQNPELPRETRRLLDPVIIDVAAARVAEVAIEHGDGERVLIAKEDPEQANFTVVNLPEGRELQFPGVANVTGNALRELRLEDVERLETDATANGDATSVRFRTFDGLVIDVHGSRRNAEAWITLAAGVEPAAEAGSEGSAEAASEQNAEPAEASIGAQVSAEAEAINARVRGWRYRVASHQYDQMARRMSDLLQPEDDEDNPSSNP